MVDACLSRHFYCIDQNRTKMATFFATPSPPSTLHFLHSSPLRFPRCLWSGLVRREKLNSIHYTKFVKWNRRRTLICAANQDAENSFRKTVEMDRLIDTLRAADDKELQKLVVENVLSFNESFWIRLAARADNCKSEDDKKDLEELASFLMSLVDSIVHKTYEKIESATDVLKAILRPAAQEEDEIPWPPRNPEALSLMEKELNQREQEGQLDEGFLSEVNAQLRNAKEDGDKPGLEAMLQKVLQLYTSRVLSKRSYARKGDEILKAEQFFETIIKGDAYHITQPHFGGRGAILAMTRALNQSGLHPSQVDYINAHATSTLLGGAVNYALLYDITLDLKLIKSILFFCVLIYFQQCVT